MLINIIDVFINWDMFYYLFSAFGFCGVFMLLKYLIVGRGRRYYD